MSKLALGITIAALAATRAPAQAPLSAEQALARQQSSLRSGLGLGCEREAGEIVVCARQGPDPNRLPLPVPPEPGARTPGAPVDPSETLALSAEKCTPVGRDPKCNGGLPILGIAIMIVKTVVEAAVKDEE